MRLQRKLFLFSAGIAAAVSVFLIGYMILLLPNMYLDYSMEKNRSQAISAHQSFSSDGKAGGEGEKIPGNFIGIILPRQGYVIRADGSYFSATLVIPEGELRTAFDEARSYLSDLSFSESDTSPAEDLLSEEVSDSLPPPLEKLADQLRKELYGTGQKQLADRWQAELKTRDVEADFTAASTRLIRLGSRSGLGEFSITDSATGSRYTSFIGFTASENSLYVSMNTVATPSVSDIRPVILGALPLLFSMIILLGFAISWLVGRSIVQPITELARDADGRRQLHRSENIPPISVRTSDEIGDLAASLNLLYQTQAEDYRLLEEASSRKQVFLRASAHQLKTPLAAASLLVEGMISRTGKYADRDTYLPETQNRLSSMRKIIDEIMSLDRMAENPDRSPIPVRTLTDRILADHRPEAEARHMTWSLTGEATWISDGEMLYKILDNLILNALTYSDEGGEVHIDISPARIQIKNHPARLEQGMKETIFEPFVSGSITIGGHGLGLYVSRYFADALHCRLTVSAEDDWVIFCLEEN